MTEKNNLKRSNEVSDQTQITVDWKSGDISGEPIIVVGANQSRITIVRGKNSEIDKLDFKNKQLQQELTILNKQYNQAKEEIKIRQRSQEIMPGDKLEKYIIPVLITVVAAALAGSVSQILGYLVGIVVAIYFIYKFSNNQETVQPETLEIPKHEQIRLRKEQLQNQIELNNREIFRLYNSDTQ